MIAHLLVPSLLLRLSFDQFDKVIVLCTASLILNINTKKFKMFNRAEICLYQPDVRLDKFSNLQGPPARSKFKWISLNQLIPLISQLFKVITFRKQGVYIIPYEFKGIYISVYYYQNIS